MAEKKNKWLIPVFIIALIAAGIGGYLIGKDKGITETEASYQEEKELDILLNRSELEGLGDIEGKIYVTGHKTPDTDTVCGAIAYAELFRQLGYDAEPVVLGELNDETKYILKELNVQTPMLLEDASGCTMILIDHSEYSQSAEGLEDANIISIIDHHGDGSVTTGNLLVYDARPLGSTATIIWIRYRNYGLEPDQKTAALMLGAVLSDTLNLKSVITTEADREAVKALSKLAGIEDTDAFYQEMYKASISYAGMTDEEIYLSDYKVYEAGSKKFGIGCINVYDEEGALDMVERMKKLIPSVYPSTGADLAFAQISIFHDDFNINYIVASDEAAEELFNTAFCDIAEFNGTYFYINPGVSRKKTLVPGITALLEAYPQE